MRTIWIPVLFLWVPFANAKTITWIYLDFSPYYILSGSKKGLGRDEGVIHLLEKVMPSYRFKYLVLPASRAIHSLSDPNNTVCMLSLYKTTQRLKHISFSNEASTIGLSPSLAVRKSTLNELKLNMGQEVSLAKLIHQSHLALGISHDRSFGDALDEIIRSTDPTQLIIRPGKEPLASLTNMLLKERVDMILGYPSEHYHLQQKFDRSYRLSQLTIKEAGDFAYGYIGCTKRPDSKQLITDLDVALKLIKQSNEFDQTMLYWLPTELQPKLAAQLSQLRSPIKSDK